MNKKKTKINNVLQAILIVICFIFVFFIKALNNIEAKGYFMKDEETGEITQIIVKKLNNLDNIDDKYIYEYDGDYYITGEDGLPKYMEIEVVDEVPTKKDFVVVGRLYVIKSEFFSAENLRETITDAKYWILSISLSLALTVSYSAAFSIKKNNLLIGEEYKGKQSEYINKMKLKPLNFSKYIREDNLREKKKIYKEKILEKLAVQQCKIDRIDNITSKKFKRIQKKIDFYNKIISDDYINKHIYGLKINYYALNPDNFRSSDVDINISGRKDKSEESKVMAKVYTKKLLRSIICSLILAALVLSFYINFAFDGELWFMLVSTAFGLLISVINGFKQAETIYKNEYLGVLCNKISIIEDSIKWAINNPSEEKGFEEVIQNYLNTWKENKQQKKAIE